MKPSKRKRAGRVPPYFCRHHNHVQLYRVEVHDVKANEPMGHLWKCPRCGEGSIGYGNPGEYTGEPIPATGAKK